MRGRWSTVQVRVLAAAAMATALPIVAAPLVVSAAGTANVSITGTVSGGVKVAQTGDRLTFTFTERNNAAPAKAIDLDLVSVSHAALRSLSCVLPNGSTFNPDGNLCEPGFLKAGQSASSVATVKVTGASGSTVSVKTCVSNERTGAVGPCKTLSVTVA